VDPRSVGTRVVLVDGRARRLAQPRRSPASRLVAEDEPRRTRALTSLASELARLADETAGRQGLLIGEVNGQPVSAHALAPFLADAGFSRGAMGMARVRTRH
jgi:hypothetical protein